MSRHAHLQEATAPLHHSLTPTEMKVATLSHSISNRQAQRELQIIHFVLFTGLVAAVPADLSLHLPKTWGMLHHAGTLSTTQTILTIPGYCAMQNRPMRDVDGCGK